MSRGRAARAVVAVLLTAVALAGCASLTTGDPDATLSPAARNCLNFYAALDRRVDVEGVRDGTDHRLGGFPYLRADRFTASFGDEIEGLVSHQALTADVAANRDRVDGASLAGTASGGLSGRGSAGAARDAWLGRMAMLDRTSRQYEIENLPATAYPVAGYPDPASLSAQVSYCSRLLVDAHGADPRRADALVRASEVPDDYSRLQRALGLYPLSGVGIANGIRRQEAESRAAFGAERARARDTRVVYQRYAPAMPNADTAAVLADSRRIVGAAPRDALGVPLLDAGAVAKLAALFAPTFEIATSAEHDRFGPLQWIDLGGLVGPKAERYWLDVDPSQPVVYYQLGYTRFAGAVLPQLVYTVWFPERMAADGSDWQAGRIDGLIWRVTLDPEGQPLLFDAVNPSGCCHAFFNTARLMPKAPPPDHEVGEWAFAPAGMPIENWIAGAGLGDKPVGSAPPVGAVALHIGSHDHQLVGVAAVDSHWGEPVVDNPPYRLEPAGDLRALPRPGSSSRSVFDRNGQIAGSERMLRFALWPTGIDNAGVQRQITRLPTAYAGRRHFDDPDLIESRFRLRP